MKTREKILQQARLLFNEHGVSSISSRKISEAVGIHYGNLCYYFPKKEDILLQLYHDMQEELDKEVFNLREEIFRFDFMVRGLRGMLEVLYKYKFIYLDLTDLTRKLPEIKAHTRRQYQKRMNVCREIYSFLQLEGYLKPEKMSGHYDKLTHGILMIINGWIVDGEIFYDGEESAKPDHYLELIYRVISASLTSKGQENFIKVYEDAGWVLPVVEMKTED